MTSVRDTHLEFVEKLKARGEEILMPKFEKPMGNVDGYIKIQIPHKDAGSIFKDKYGTYGLFGDMGALHITGIKWEDLGLCDARCWYEWMDPETYRPEPAIEVCDCCGQEKKICPCCGQVMMTKRFIRY